MMNYDDIRIGSMWDSGLKDYAEITRSILWDDSGTLSRKLPNLALALF